MKLKSLITAAAITALSAGGALADAHGGKLKVGMITTLSGGGAGLGITEAAIMMQAIACMDKFVCASSEHS